jgi:Protein of unknown function (DUF3037)
MSLFEYALLRVVPRVERGEYINAGVVLYCQDAKFLDARIRLDQERLRALDPNLDPETVRAHLEVARRVCEGGAGAGAVGMLPQGQRFGWLVAPRSTVVQPYARVDTQSRAFTAWDPLASFTFMGVLNGTISKLTPSGELDVRLSHLPDVYVSRLEGSL